MRAALYRSWAFRLGTRPSIGLLVSALLCGGVCACGGSTDHALSTGVSSDPRATTDVSATPPYWKVDADKDNDVEAGYDDTQNNGTLNFGHAASPSDERAIKALVKHYYAVALAADGTSACEMIYSPLAESIPEDYGTVDGPSYMRGIKTCAAGMKALFRHYHTRLAAEVPILVVSRVRLVERHGLAILRFGKLPEREILITHEGPAWKIAAVLDIELP
jgi:hypothetical protein